MWACHLVGMSAMETYLTDSMPGCPVNGDLQHSVRQP